MAIHIEDRQVCVIDGVDYTVLYHFNVAHIGWESDHNGYIINYDGQNRLVLSNHGKFYMVDDDKVSPFGEIHQRKDVLELQLQIDSYRELINNTNKAIEYLTESRFS